MQITVRRTKHRNDAVVRITLNAEEYAHLGDPKRISLHPADGRQIAMIWNDNGPPSQSWMVHWASARLKTRSVSMRWKPFQAATNNRFLNPLNRPGMEEQIEARSTVKPDLGFHGEGIDAVSALLFDPHFPIADWYSAQLGSETGVPKLDLAVPSPSLDLDKDPLVASMEIMTEAEQLRLARRSRNVLQEVLRLRPDIEVDLEEDDEKRLRRIGLRLSIRL